MGIIVVINVVKVVPPVLPARVYFLLWRRIFLLFGRS